MFSGSNSRPGFNFICQFRYVGAAMGVKALSGFVFLAAGLALSLPAVFYWHMLGGYIPSDRLLLLYADTFSLAFFIMALRFSSPHYSVRGAASCGPFWPLCFPCH